MNVSPYSGLGLACFLSVLAVPVNADNFKLNISKFEDLKFGSMVVISPGTVTLDPRTGHRSGTAHVMVPTSVQSNSSPAKFTVTCADHSGSRHANKLSGKGENALKYRLELVTTPVDGASSQMVMTNFQISSPFGQLSNEREVANCTGYSETIYVGATMTVGMSQPSGNYTSSNDIMLEVRITSDE